MSPKLYQRLLRQSFLIPSILSLFLAGLLLYQIQELTEAYHWVDHSDEVVGTASEFEKLVVDGETGVRGYAATGDRLFLEPYEKALKLLPHQISKLKGLVVDNLEQSNRTDVLNDLWIDKFEWIKGTINEADHGKVYKTRLLEGKKKMDNIRQKISELKSAELNMRTKRSGSLQKISQITLLLTVVLFFIFAGVFGYNAKYSLRALATSYELATKELFESREWLAITLKSIGDGVIVIDRSGKIAFLNPIAENLTGWKLKDAKDRPTSEVFDIINQETRKPAFNPIQRVLDEGIVLGLANHTVLISKDKTERPIEDSAAPIKDKENNVVGVVLVFRDMTEKYMAVSKLETLASELSKAVHYRDEFLSLASHELKTPLTSLNLQLQSAQRKVSRGGRDFLASGLQEKMLNISIEQVKRLAKLVDDLLDVSRVESGHLSYDFEALNLSEVVRSQIERLGSQFTERGVSLETQIAETVILNFDRFRIEQVIENLLVNAIKYGDDKPVFISLEVKNNFAVLKVKDQGIGVAEDKRDLIFNRFERAITQKNISGLGLGLYIAKQIILAHNGKIGVVSELNRGSTFIVELPI